MATGSPVSFWYGTRAQFDAITTKLDTTLYFITDEQTLYKGSIKFSGSGVETLLTISSTQPDASAVTTGDKYFNTSDNLIHVLSKSGSTVTTTATYEPANGALYYNADAQRFQTLIKDGNSYVVTEIYDAGISVEDGTGLALDGTTVSGVDATANSKGVVQVGTNLNVTDGVVSAPVATSATFGMVKTGDNVTNTNGIISVAKATTSSLGVVKIGQDLSVDANGNVMAIRSSKSQYGTVHIDDMVDTPVVLNVLPEDVQDIVNYVPNMKFTVRGFQELKNSKQNTLTMGEGLNMTVSGSTMFVTTASTSAKGIVQLVNDPASLSSKTTAITPHAVSLIVEDINSRKQDNLSNGNVTTISDAKIDVNVGDGLDVGVTGTANANKLIVNEASVKEVLEDVVDGGTEPAVNEIVTADNLRGALSVGQAVDVSCPALANDFTNISTDGGQSWQAITQDLVEQAYLGDFIIEKTTGTSCYFGFTGSTTSYFPKYASNLKYLFIFDFKITGKSSLGVYWHNPPAGGANGKLFNGSSSTWTRAYIILETPRFYISCNSYTTPLRIEFKNWRQYEVTALTDEAIAYIAQLPDPDAFFRSTNAYSIRDKYLIKQDMVCPFIPTIEMSNSDLTVAAGLSYKMTYKSNTPTTRTITADTVPTKAYGWDTHLQLFVDDNTTVNFQYPLVLEDPLTPNAGHNMTIKWRNGQALVYVDDMDIGYIVTVTAGTENGSLYYGLTNDTGEYITFANTTDGTPIELDGTTVSKTINIIGNGSDKTIIDGYIYSRKTSYEALNITGISCTQGITTLYAGTTTTLNINNCHISGATHYQNVTGSDNFQKCMVGPSCSIYNTIFDNMNPNGITGYWGVIALYKPANSDSAKFINCTYKNAGKQNVHLFCGNTLIKDSIFIDNIVYEMGGGNAYYHGVIYNISGSITIENCLFSNNHYLNSSTRGSAVAVGINCTISGSTFATVVDDIRVSSGATVSFAGTNIINSRIFSIGTCNLLEDCTIDLSSNTNSKVYNNDNNAVIEAVSGAQVIPYGETEPVAVEGTGNTLLNNGKLGFLVSVASGTASNTLYDALVGGGTNYSNVVFDPVLDGQTVSLATGTYTSNGRTIIGNGTSSTIITGQFTFDTAGGQPSSTLQDITISGATAMVAYGILYRTNSYNCIFTDLKRYNNNHTFICAVGGRIEGCTIQNCNVGNARIVDANGGSLVLNCTFTDNVCTGGEIYVSDGTSSITGCTFTGNSVSTAINVKSATGVGHGIVTGCTFGVNKNIYIAGGGAGGNGSLTFSGTNILNSTVSGAGTVVFADGTTVTSTIPSGSTIGTGVISALPKNPIGATNVLLENVTISGITPVGALIRATTNNSITLRNCVITGNTISQSDGSGNQAYAVFGDSGAGKTYLDNVTIIGNTGVASNQINALYGYISVKDCTIESGIVAYQGVLDVFGDNTVKVALSANPNATAKLILNPDSIVRHPTSSISAGTNMIYVGTYNESTGTVTTTGTATVVLNGTSVTVSGSGTTIDSTGLHS